MPTPGASEPPLIAAPDAAAVERFRRDFTAAAGALPDDDHPMGVAVSGGGDSLALLLLAQAAFPGAVRAATVDHRLRPESADEAEAVAALCARLAVPHAILVPETGASPCGNLPQWARRLRYALLCRWAAAGHPPLGWIAVAHQQDDLAETLLMRMRRGAGVGGLAAMAAMRPLRAGQDETRLVRPLLGWSRAELGALVGAAGLAPVDDPSNAAERFDRARVRVLLAEHRDALPAPRLAMAAQNLRHAEDALAWMAAREWTTRHRVEPMGCIAVDMAGLPYELRRRLVRCAIAAVRGDGALPPTAASNGLDRLVMALDTGRGATLAGVAAWPGKWWRFRAAPPRRSH